MQRLIDLIHLRHWWRKGCPHVTQDLVPDWTHLSWGFLGCPPVRPWRRRAYSLCRCSFAGSPLCAERPALPGSRALARRQPRFERDVAAVAIGLPSEEIVVIEVMTLLVGWTRICHDAGCTGFALLVLGGLIQAAACKQRELLLRCGAGCWFSELLAVGIPHSCRPCTT